MLLKFLGLTLTPEYYDEHDFGGNKPLVIVTEVTPSAEENEALERYIMNPKSSGESESSEGFDLRRIGLHDEPLRVTFGRCLWQKDEDGLRRHQLVFIAAGGDDEQPGDKCGNPHDRNLARVALQGREIAEAIIEEMALADLLTPEALERIHQRSESSWDKRFRDLSETSDLSQFR